MNNNDISNPFAVILNRVDSLSEKVDKILGKNLNEDGPQRDEYLKIDEAAEYLGLKISTLHTHTRKNTIKHYKRSGRVYFLRSELHEYIKQGKVLVNDGKAVRRH